ncbi:MAG TPA: cation:proton antiporter [Xanthobacteraceae bacterium]|nr:cation:proton antiporter [Xanthobacteraceae bacterium]
MDRLQGGYGCAELEDFVVSGTTAGGYSDALIVLGTAGIVVPVVRRWGLSAVLGYLGAGAILGPLGLGSISSTVPTLSWFTISDARNVAGIAQLGIVFLLFLIGLELSFPRLSAMRRLVIGLGGSQILLTSALIAGAAVFVGKNPPEAIVLGASLSLSSTAIVLELLSNQERLTTSVGRASFSVLLAQDLAVIPILLFISILAARSGGSALVSLGSAVLQAAIAIIIIVVFGRVLLRPLFRLVATARSNELFIAAVLFVIVAAGVIADQAGLSMALGAFVAGLLLAETEYRKAIEAVVGPFKGLLIGIFFFTVGMNIDFREVVREPLLLFGGVFALIAVKALLLIGLGKAFRLTWPVAVETGLLLGPGGEFAFVSIGLAAAAGLVGASVASFTLTVTSFTMALTPLLSLAARHIAAQLTSGKAIDPEVMVRPAGGQQHAIVVGYGRVGKVVCALLREHGIPYIAADSDAATVARDRRDGHDVYNGNAADPLFLESCGLGKAAGVIITIHTASIIDDVVEHVRAMRPDILIVSRARDADHARHLYGLGATDAVPETIEASLQLSEAALVGLGVATGLAIASIHERRDEIRHALQQAAQDAGREKIHSIRAKTSGAQGAA